MCPLASFQKLHQERQYSTTVEVRDFANANVRNPSVAMLDEERPDDPANASNRKTARVRRSYARVACGSDSSGLSLSVYRNGRDASSCGHVSLVFRRSRSAPKTDDDGFQQQLTTCVVSVLDSEGERRMPSSYVLEEEEEEDVVSAPEFAVDRYLPRSVLLGEPSEFLPKGTLTLQVDVLKRIPHAAAAERDVSDDEGFFRYLGITRHPAARRPQLFAAAPHSSDENFRLDARSRFARDLARESSVLRFLLSLDREKGLEIPEEEYQGFETMGRLLCGEGRPRRIPVRSLDAIMELYATADKYDVPCVAEACRRWLGLCLSAENVEDVAEFAYGYRDGGLRNIAEDFSANVTNEDDEWGCCCCNNEDGQGDYCFYRKSAGGGEEEEEEFSEADRFDFYT